MKKVFVCLAALLFTSTISFAQSAPPAKSAQQSERASVTLAAAPAAAHSPYVGLPLSFEKNNGQSDARVKFMSRGPGYNLFLTGDEAVLALPQGPAPACAKKGNAKPCTQAEATAPRKASFLRLKMAGAAPNAGVSGLDRLPGNTSYFIGNDPRKWHANVPNFEKVEYSNIYPGIDLIYYGNQQQLESDFVLAPGADPQKIQIEIDGASRTRLDAQGNLVFSTGAGDVRLMRPGIYQIVRGAHVNVEGHYVLLAENRVGFEVGPYDAAKPLVIDPTLVYATFLGGSSLSGDLGNAITVDGAGNAYVTGQTSSVDFPGTVLFPASQGSFFFFFNTFVSKFNPAGSALVYSAVLGGQSFDSGEGGYGIGVDGSGNAIVAGTTDASNFPTVNPFQATFGGGFETGFVTKVAPDGASLVYSTFFGGRNASDQTNANGIAVEAAGNAFVVGSTTSPNFPTISPMQATLNGDRNAFVAKFDVNGQAIYSTYLGGDQTSFSSPTATTNGYAIAVDSNHKAYVTGQTDSANFPGASIGFQKTLNGTNAFVTRLSADGSSIDYSTYLGGTNDTSSGNGIAVDSAFDAYVTGTTSVSTFPVTGGAAQTTFTGSGVTHAFITKLNPAGTAQLYSTFLGGEKSDTANAIALDSSNNAYVAGGTLSSAFNIAKPMQAALAGGQDAFIARVNAAGSAFDYSTYLGGNGTDQANGIAVVPASGNAYVVGTTTSVNFPVLGGVQSTLLNSVGNAFVAELSPTTPSTITLFPPAFSFGQIGIGQTSFSEPVTLSNFTGGAVAINSISFTGANAGDFAQTNTCGASIANNATCIITVTFSPTVQDLRSATLSVSDGGTGSPHTMAVSGIGTVPEVSLSKTSIDFGSNDPLNYPTTNSVQVTNTGGVPLHITSVQFSGPNAPEFTSTSCITTLAPGGSCFVSISFIPTAAGLRTASLLLNDDAAGSPQILPLSGTGVPQVIVRPSAVNYGSQIVGVSSFAADYTLINGSGVVVTLTNGSPAAIVEGGTNPGDFPINAGPTTCKNGLVLPLGGTCIVEAKFLPTAAGARSATISFNYTGFAGSPQVATLTGIGLVGVSVAVNPANFGSQYVGFTLNGSDQLINATAGAITVSSIAIGGTNPTDFTAALSDTCAPGGVVPANTSCSISGTFTPSALGPRSATATISFTGATGSPIVVNLSGTGIPGPVTLNKGFLTYGGQIVLTASLPQRVILTNLSSVDVHNLNISTGNAVFTLASSSTCINGGTVKAGTSCAMDVVFTPTATGAVTSNMTVADDDAGSPRTVVLSGVGEPSVVSVSTSTLDFGNQTVGQTAAARAVFLINAGASQITITTPGSITGTNASEFAIVNGAGTTCTNGAHILGSGGTCSVAITFTPSTQGSRTATLTIIPSSGGTQTVTLQGTGVLTPKISLSSTFVFFNSQPTGTTSAAQTVTVTNTGNGPLTLTSISLTGTNAGDFTTSGSTCAINTPIPAAPGPGNTCTFSIAFAPVETGTLFATLSITSNANNNPNTTSSISVDGIAVAGGAGVVVDPASFDFGAVALNSTSNSEVFTLTNNTATPLVTGTLAFGGTNAGDFSFLFAPSCGTLTAFGGQCQMFVQFTPKGAGARSGQLQIPFTGPAGSPINVNLSGTGSTILAFAPSPVAFPSTSVGGFASITATLSNGSASTVTLTNTPAITGTNAADFTIGFTTCASGTPILASGGSSCQVSINFSPTARGNRTAQLVYTLSVGGPLTLVLNGSATGPVMSLSPSPLTFPNQTVNTQSSTLFVTVSNTGDSTLFLSNETLTGTNGNDFSFPNFNSCFSIAAGSSCTVAVAFTPFAQGARTGLLTVIPQAPLASQSVVLNGTGQLGTVTVTPTSLTYASQNQGTTSGAQLVQLKNTTNAPVTLTGVLLSGTNLADYAIAAGTTCTNGAIIHALTGTCIVNITFSPTGTINPRTATVTITDNTGAHPVSLSGTGANPVVSVSPNPLTFATNQLLNTTSAPQTVTLSNFTGAAVSMTSTPTITGTNAGDFAIGTDSCTGGTGIPALTGSCSVAVTFKPTGTGPRTATLTLIDGPGDAGSPHLVTLNGTGIAPNLTIGKVHTGNFTVGQTGTYTITVSNSGGAPTTGTTTVTDTLPTGMTFNSNTNSGLWTCVTVTQTITCTSSTAIAATSGSSAFNLVVNVAAAAAGTPINSATVTNAGDTGTTGKTATDPTTVTFPLPTISTISPTSATAGAAGFTLTVNGTNFVSGSVVNFHGAAKTTTFVSATQITATITTADIAAGGTFNVTVTNPAPGGGTSGTSPFTVNNPVPTLTSLSPSGGLVNGAGFTMTVNGTNFNSSSVVNYNGAARTTTFVSATQLTIQILAGDLAAFGTFPVTVTNPAPGGGTTAAVNFAVTNPPPTITTISPTSATAGGAGFTLTVNGTGFVSGATVAFHGANKTTAFVSATQVTATILAADIATAGTFNVTVTNPAPGGGTSGNATFTVNNPAPTITTLSPTSATAGGVAFTLTVNGTNLNTSSVVNFNGAAKTTTFVSATQVTAAITAADIASAGTFNVSVTNPAPGGGTSANSPFAVNNPAPAITALSPTSANKGGTAFTLTVNGSNFVSTSVVNFNGAAKTTTFVSATQVTAAIAAADIAAAGTFNVTVTNPAPGGGTSGNATFTVNNPAPTITTLSPASAIVGGGAFTLTVNGTNFVSGAVVNFNGAAKTTTFVSATQVTAAIAAADIATAGTFNVSVTNPAPGGGTTTNASFAVNNPVPAITTLSPSSATKGGTAFTLTVNGTNFISSSVVNFNGAARTTTFVSATQVTAAITAADIAAAGAFNVTVTNPAPGGGTSGNATFTVNNPVPTIASLSPNGTIAGGAGFTLTVNGTNFVATSVVNFNGSARTTSFVSATQLTATIPSADIATVGSGNVTVTNPAPGGGTTTNFVFTISSAPNPVPTLTTISPTSGLVGQAVNLTLTGTNFIAGSIVNFGASADTGGVATNGGATLTISIPAGQVTAAGTVNVSVTNPAPGGGTSAVQTFTINNPVPAITTLSPTSAATGGAAFTLTVNGTNFVSTSVVKFNGSARTTTFVSATQLTAAITPADIAAAGTFNVTVTNPAPGGGTSGNSSFAVNNPTPAITTLSPASATAGAGAFTLTVNGTNFVSGAVVNFNGAAKVTTFVNATQVTAAIAAGDIAAAGTFNVSVANPAPGGGASGNSQFTVNNPAPTITTLSPTSAIAGGVAFTLTVNGTNFNSSSVVNFNGAGKTTTFVSATQVTAAIPAADIAAAGTFNVTVTNPAPGGGTSAISAFTVNNPVPTITTISPTSASAGGVAFTLTVNGTNFNSSSVVKFNGTARTTTLVNATQVTAAITAADIAAAGTFNVTVTNPAPGGGTSGNSTFTVNNPVPTITTISPSSATKGGAAFTLTVNGTNFLGTSVVNFNGAAKVTTFVSATQVTAAITAADIAAAGTFNVTVTNPAPGGGTSGTSPFAVNNPVPTITTLSPTNAIVGSAAFTLTVNGTGFLNGATLSFNGVVRATAFVSATQVTAAITAADIATAGTLNVTVSNPAPTSGPSAAVTFAVNNPVPTVTSVSPTSGTAGGAAFTLTVNGTNFVATSVVNFNGAAKTTTFVSATQVTAAITAADIAAAGTLNVSVTNPGPGGGASGNSSFTVNNPAPTVTTISPTGGIKGGAAFTLTVNGTNFNASSVVNFNGAAKTTTLVSATQVTAAITAADIAATGAFNVSVTNPAPGGGTSGTATFNVTDFNVAQATTGTVSVTAGTPATVTLNVTTTPAIALPADVTFTCALPAGLSGATCALNPTTITKGSPSGASTVLTISTTASLPPSSRRRDPWTPFMPLIPVTALAGMAILWLTKQQRIAALRGRPVYLALALLVITSAGLVGCSTAMMSTQKGPSSVTVTATSGGVAKQINVAINVQ
ncbi:MAG: choice-of-anchor D domain-containing protein [Acidobacteriia bacterium]|nr:choice-of-anchor D domain-containing protein [Terriglobia bacterium]